MIGTSSNKKNKNTSSSNGRSSSRSGSRRRHTKKNNLDPNDTHNNTNNGQRSSSPSIGVYDPTAAVDSKWAKFEANNPDSNTTDTIDNNIHMQSSSTPNRIRRPSAGLIRTSSIGSTAKSNANSTANSNTNGGTNTNHHRSVTPVKRNASRIKNPASSSKPRQTQNNASYRTRSRSPLPNTTPITKNTTNTTNNRPTTLLTPQHRRTHSTSSTPNHKTKTKKQHLTKQQLQIKQHYKQRNYAFQIPGPLVDSKTIDLASRTAFEPLKFHGYIRLANGSTGEGIVGWE